MRTLRYNERTTVFRSIVRKGAAVTLAACAAALFCAAPAAAEFGILSLDTDTHTPVPNPADPSLPPSRHTSQAGAHADSTLIFRMRTKSDEFGYPIPDGALRDVVLDLPAGFAGNPQSMPLCDPAVFNNLMAGSCPPSTQVGIAKTEIPIASMPQGPPFLYPSAVYNLVPAKGETAAFGFYVATVPVKIVASVRTDGDFGLRTTVANISQASTVFGQELTLWGVPADPIHDHERYNGFIQGSPAGVPPRPFLTLPAACNGPQVSVLRVRAWGEDNWVTEEDLADDPNTGDTSGPKGCDKLGFDARLSMQPSDTRAGSPSPYTAKLEAAFDDTPKGLGNAHVKEVSVKLPNGTAISPPNADGLKGCTPEQLKLGSTEDSACPDGSKIGDVQIDTPLLAEPLRGDVYLRQPTRDQLFALALVVRGSGMIIKLPGEIYPDKQTGQITTVFRNNPQLSFTTMTLRFKGGPRAPLANPQTCGVHTTTTTITSWAGHTQTSSDSFTIDKGSDGGPCRPLGFAPSFRAGSADPAAGASSAFALTFGRSDADQDLSNITVQLPEGVTGKLAVAEQCPEALANAGACDESSRVGSVTVGSGGGSNPLYLNGRGVYLTGPYKGAPLGLVIVVPAVAGPFDLGTVVVRAAIHVDRKNASLRVAADPMPWILEGVPLRVRTVNVRMDRAGFMVNPTNCRAKTISGTIASTAGATAAVSSRFAAANCRSLPLKPRMVVTIGERGRTRANSTVPFTAKLTQTPGQSNLKQVAVRLPFSLASRLEVINRSIGCTPEVFDAERCTVAVGQATALSPLLRDPLRGNVYLVRNPARRLPDLMVRLRAQGWTSGIAIDLTGHVKIERDLTIRTTFENIPDVPVSNFTLRLVPGRNGVIRTVPALCSAESRNGRATLGFRGHNGKYVSAKQKLRISGCGAARRGSSRRAASRRGSARAGKR